MLWLSLILANLHWCGLTTATESTPSDPFPMRPGLWLEAASANAASSYGLHRPVILALKGETPDASAFLRTLHPFYDPYKNPMTLSQVRSWAKQVLSSPDVDGLGLDHEGWTLEAGIPLLQVLYEEANAAGKVFCDVPEITLVHPINGTDGSFAAQVKVLEATTHCVLPWLYCYKADDYLAAVSRWRGAGYTKQILPMGDSGFRPSYGGITPEDAVQTVRTMAAHNLSFSLFEPNHGEQSVFAAMKECYP